MSAVLASLLGFALLSNGQEQYPPPLQHTPANHPAQRVILLSIDGLHAFDLQQWVSSHPSSALALLSRRGVTYTNAQLPWDDPAVGLLALATGGTPLSTGVPAARFFARELSPAGSQCAQLGAAVDLVTMTARPGDAVSALVAAQDPQHGCERISPHQLLRVNNIFELVVARGGRTAWAGDRAGLVDLLRGPTGKGLTEGVTVPVAAQNPDAAVAADKLRLAALLHWIDGEDSVGRDHAGVPELLGANFSEFAAVQRSSLGYKDNMATPSAELVASLGHIDDAIARIVAELRNQHIFDSTWIIVTATYALSPVDGRPRQYISSGAIRAALHSEGIEPAEITTDGMALVWLRDRSKTEAAAEILAKCSDKLGIGKVETNEYLRLFIESRDDPRGPDLVLKPNPGVTWSGNGENAVLGLDEDATHVALLVSGTGLTGRSDPTLVPTTQTAALLLRALGMEKFDLTALHREHSPALPGVF